MKKEDSAGVGPQNMFVNLLLMAQYAGQSNSTYCPAEPVLLNQKRRKHNGVAL